MDDLKISQFIHSITLLFLHKLTQHFVSKHISKRIPTGNKYHVRNQLFVFVPGKILEAFRVTRKVRNVINFCSFEWDLK